MKTITVILTAVFCLGGDILAAAYSGGDGTSGNPYQIANIDDLKHLSETPTDWSMSFILTADIDLASLPFAQAPIAPDTSTSSGFQGVQFTGTFDGDGHAISNLTIVAPTGDYVGLFGYIAKGEDSCGEVRNVGIAAADISGSSYVGALVGFNGGIVTACYAAGRVDGAVGPVGGLAGAGEGEVSICYAIDSVKGSEYVGGLVGRNDSGLIADCYAAGPVTGEKSVGGLVGMNDSGSVTNCFWDTQTSGQTTSDGGVGKTTAEMMTGSTFIAAGWDFSNIDGDPADWRMDPLDYPSLQWEPAVPRYSGGDGSTGNPYQIANVTDFQLLVAAPTDWSSAFIMMADIDLGGVAVTPVGSSSTQFTGVFDGNGHVISNLTIAQPGSNYVGPFGYVGAGGQIRELGVEDVTLTGDSYVGGMAGYSAGSLIDCYATGSVSGRYIAGGLVGHGSGSLSSCYAAVSTSGTDGFVGGIVGTNSGSITACYATGSAAGSMFIGGMVGWNDGPVTACYAVGPVTGDSYAGGLVGRNYGSVNNCYSAGLVTCSLYGGGLVGRNNGSVTGSFWDTQTSGRSASYGGTGQTTAQMKTLSTFAAAGWDLVNVWGIGERQTYPYLRMRPAADLNNDDQVNMLDFAIFANQWLAGV